MDMTTPQHNGPEQEDFLTEAQLADYLAFSQRTIRRWRRAGLSPAVRLPSGRGFRYRVSAINKTISDWEQQW